MEKVKITLPPTGFIVLRDGTVQPGDRLWVHLVGWREALESHFNRNVREFYAVARKV